VKINWDCCEWLRAVLFLESVIVESERANSLKKISTRDDMSRPPRRDGGCDISAVAVARLKRLLN
jgi:hypothetical protein